MIIEKEEDYRSRRTIAARITKRKRIRARRSSRRSASREEKMHWRREGKGKTYGGGGGNKEKRSKRVGRAFTVVESGEKRSARGWELNGADS